MSHATLIVNADDFGLTEGISRGILVAHRRGVVTSTSVLALGAALERSTRWLGDAPELGTGAHLALVGEDPPLLAAREIPTLVDERGRLPRSWRQLLARMAARRVDPDDVRRELSAQLQRLLALGLRLTHLDTHQHVHLWPAIADVVVALARAHRIPAVRVPRSSGRRWAGLAVNALARGLVARARAAGLRFPSLFWGFDEAGHLERADVLRMIDGLARHPGAIAELGAHPGERDEAAATRYRWGYTWDAELALLTDPALRRALDAHGVRLASYAILS